MADTQCPLCCKDMDSTDLHFKPCQCGYQICLWCYHKLMEKENPRCPACRTPYSAEKTIEQQPDVLADDALSLSSLTIGSVGADKSKSKDSSSTGSGATVAASAAAAAAAGKLKKRGPPHPNMTYEELSNIRVRQKNLVYVVGLPSTLCDENILKTNKWFGRFGKIKKVYCNRKSSHPSRTGSFAAFVTFFKEKDAMGAIGAMNGHSLDDGRMLRATTGSTKYCSYFLRQQVCSNPSCLYLHDWARTDDIVTKEELNDFGPISAHGAQQSSPPAPNSITLRTSRSNRIALSTSSIIKKGAPISHYDYTKRTAGIAPMPLPPNSGSTTAQTGPISPKSKNLAAIVAAANANTSGSTPSMAPQSAPLAPAQQPHMSGINSYSMDNITPQYSAVANNGSVAPLPATNSVGSAVSNPAFFEEYYATASNGSVSGAPNFTATNSGGAPNAAISNSSSNPDYPPLATSEAVPIPSMSLSEPQKSPLNNPSLPSQPPLHTSQVPPGFGSLYGNSDITSSANTSPVGRSRTRPVAHTVSPPVTSSGRTAGVPTQARRPPQMTHQSNPTLPRKSNHSPPLLELEHLPNNSSPASLHNAGRSAPAQPVSKPTQPPLPHNSGASMLDFEGRKNPPIASVISDESTPVTTAVNAALTTVSDTITTAMTVETVPSPPTLQSDTIDTNEADLSNLSRNVPDLPGLNGISLGTSITEAFHAPPPSNTVIADTLISKGDTQPLSIKSKDSTEEISTASLSSTHEPDSNATQHSSAEPIISLQTRSQSATPDQSQPSTQQHDENYVSSEAVNTAQNGNDPKHSPKSSTPPKSENTPPIAAVVTSLHTSTPQTTTIAAVEDTPTDADSTLESNLSKDTSIAKPQSPRELTEDQKLADKIYKKLLSSNDPSLHWDEHMKEVRKREFEQVFAQYLSKPDPYQFTPYYLYPDPNIYADYVWSVVLRKESPQSDGQANR